MVTKVPPPPENADDDTAQSEDEFARDVADRKYKVRVYREADRQLDEETRPPIILPPITSLDDLLAEPIPDQPFIIEKLAPAEGRVLLSAPNKAGKTTLRDNLVRSCGAAGYAE
jgi:hypothetical protein